MSTSSLGTTWIISVYLIHLGAQIPCSGHMYTFSTFKWRKNEMGQGK